MANTFRIPLLNPSRWVNATAVYNPEYNTRPFDDQIDTRGYKQPWQKGGTVRVQLYSDYDILTGTIYKASEYYTRQVYTTFDLTPITEAIVGVTFKCYQAEIPLADFDEGLYYAEISYTDQDENLQVWRSCLWDVREKHADTILYEYSNSTNDKDIIFDTGIVFEMRLSGTISNYEPGSEDEQYEDQYYNVLNENSIPFRTFLNSIYAKGIGVLPDWVIDKMNLIMSLNQVSIDGTYYNKFKGESFQLQRNSIGPNLDAMSTIKIIPSDNLNLTKFTTTSPTGDDTIKVIVKDQTYTNKTDSWQLAGEFTGWSELIGISFINAELDAFELKLGTTSGGIEVGDYEVTGDLSQSISIGHRFSGASTLYITVPSGVNLNNVVLYWYQYDAPNITPPDTSTPWQFGTDYFYTPRALDGFATASDMLTTHWNLATGYGQTGTVYENCKIDDITINKVPVVWNRVSYLADPTNPDLQPGADHGVTGNTVTLTKSNLPNYDLNVDSALRYKHGTAENGGNPTTALSSVDGGRGQFTMMLGGSSTPIDITPDSYLQIKFYRVT